MRTILPTGTLTFLLSDAGEVAAFDSAAEALAAAAERRRTHPAARIALHTGHARRSDDGRYTGPTLRRCRRLLEVAAAGQTLLLAPTAAQVGGAELADLGLHRLRDLGPAERVFALDGADQPLRSLDDGLQNLPVQLTSFVGREAELAAVHDLLAGPRLVTITGAGGSGKTRLALQAAAEQAGAWRDGVWWVDLGAATDSPAEPVAAAVGVLVEPVQGALRSLTSQLSGSRVLICLDNCEHLLDAAATLAGALLRECPEVALLTTSREPLGVPGETVWRMPPLDAEEALALFLDRGSQVRPWFTLDRSNELAVRRMCERLDGMPLALELAAAWLGTLTPQQIEEGLDDRFALLVRGPRGVPGRQQTLAASIDWSHDLLDEAERVVLRRLSVFAGGFTLAAARAICGPDVLTALGRLVDKSLVVAEQSRYRLLETIRSYAADRLAEAGEVDAVRDRHLDHFLAFVEHAAPELDRDKDAWRARLEAEHENLRAALDRGLAAEDAERGRRLAAGLPWLWHLHGHGEEGLEYLDRALRPGDRSVLQGRLLLGLAVVADTARPLDLEFDIAQQALEIADEHGDQRLRAMALALSAVGRFYTDFEAGWALALEAEAAGQGLARDGSRALRGIILHLRDRHSEAEALLAPAAEALLARGDRGVAATVLGFQALSALSVGEAQRARELAERAVATAEPLGDAHRVGTARSVLALVLASGGDGERALDVVGSMLRLVEGGDAFVPMLARVTGTLRLWRGDAAEAARWLERDAGPDHYLTAQALPLLAAALRSLGRSDEADAVAARGAALARTLGMPGALADALEQQGEHHEALALRVEHGLRPAQIASLEALAADLGDERAARLLGAADAARARLGYPRPPAARPPHEPLRARLGEAVFAREHAAGSAVALEEAVAYARRSRGTRKRPPGGLAALTPTELSVVRLAVQGHNNPEIGARLFMSRSTVKTHLSHVYAKLGVANRTELAAIAGAALDD